MEEMHLQQVVSTTLTGRELITHASKTLLPLVLLFTCKKQRRGSMTLSRSAALPITNTTYQAVPGSLLPSPVEPLFLRPANTMWIGKTTSAPKTVTLERLDVVAWPKVGMFCMTPRINAAAKVLGGITRIALLKRQMK
jgi:hypothetical protein